MKILKIENKAAKVKLDDSVDEWSRKELMAEIAKTYGSANFGNVEAYGEITNSAENAVDTLEIEINSPGGSVFDGFLIYNELLALRARGVVVTATINPLAASMGSVIAMGADTVRIVPNGQMMIHDAQMFAAGNSKQLAKMAKVLDGISNEIAVIYAGKTGKTTEEMREMMVEETWLSAKDAVELGLADSYFDIGGAENSLEPSDATQNNNMTFLNRLTNPASDEAIAEIAALKNQISDIEAGHNAVLSAMKAQLDAAEEAIKEAAEKVVETEDAKKTSDEKAEELETKLAETEQKVTELETKVTEIEAKVEEAEAKVVPAAIELAASAGISAPLAIEGASLTVPATMTRAQFTAMKPGDAKKFIMSGGKLTE